MKDTPSSWIKRFNNVKMSIPSKITHKLKEMPINISASILFFGGNWQVDFKIIQKCQGPKSKIILKKHERDEKVGWLIVLDIKT